MKLGPNAQYVRHVENLVDVADVEVLYLTNLLQPCSRLGHSCDYNPRLSFKDDTPRVIEKMAGVVESGGPVWDCMLLLS